MFSSSAAQVSAANFIEDVFSTYLYTGNGSTQTITNGIDLSGKGGLVWMKGRSGATDHALYDTARGATFDLASNTTAAQTTQATGLTSFDGNGFSIGALAKINTNAATYASWTFRKQAKFFDVVTYTGNGVDGRTIAHNLGSAPGTIIIKRTSSDASWPVWHRSLSDASVSYANNLFLNLTDAASNQFCFKPAASQTSSVFAVGNDSLVNGNGQTYVAYLFAHNAGGFGATGADNVISCGSYTTDGSGNGTLQVLGYEPQWIMVKAATGTAEDWVINDTMRGMFANPTPYATALRPNASNAENLYGLGANISSTGFTGFGSASRTYIYIAIRRGPMRTPTTGTSVSAANVYTGGSTVQIGFTPDLVIQKTTNTFNPGSNSEAAAWVDRLRGAPASFIPTLLSNQTAAETTGLTVVGNFYAGQTQYKSSLGSSYNAVGWAFKRAPGFFDVVCFTGNGANGQQIAHNLGVTPALIIIKSRSGTSNWSTYVSGVTYYPNTLDLSTSAIQSTTYDQYGGTSTMFQLNGNNSTYIGKSGVTYVAYLFATVAGVSKVGSYTGTGTTKQIDCGFTGGARFVLIKRTDSTGDWYVWDSARGIVAGNDPYLLLNSTAAEVTSTDYVDTYSAGFEISSTAPAAINANGGTFIFLAIA